MKIITEERLAELLKNEAKLKILEENVVNNLDYYWEAIKDEYHILMPLDYYFEEKIKNKLAEFETL